jgi:hypothetical protein
MRRKTPRSSTGPDRGDRDGPTVPYWHVWVDESGVSRQTRCELEHFALAGMSGAAPQWQDELGTFPTTLNVSVLPVGWIGDWHENPKPQWILPLAGRWYVETMDGQRIEMGCGDLSFGGDQGCTADVDGRKGHRSGTLGNEPAVLMLVQLEDIPAGSGPCRFK